MKNSLDTNAVLRYLLGDIPKQSKLVEDMLNSQTEYHVADLAVSEVAYVMERVMKLPREIVADYVRVLMSQANINCNRSLFLPVLQLYEAHPSESFVDCCLSIYAKRNDAAPLLTFDKNLAKHLPNTELIK